MRHRAGVGHARGLDDDAIELDQALAALGGQQLQRLAQVFTDGAADAAIAHLHDLFLGLGLEDVGVDVFLTELVFNHGNLLAMGFAEHALEQRGLARTEKAREDGDRNKRHGIA
ncbi:hypothetical protein D3C86_1604750 [compost metagenome]